MSPATTTICPDCGRRVHVRTGMRRLPGNGPRVAQPAEPRFEIGSHMVPVPDDERMATGRGGYKECPGTGQAPGNTRTTHDGGDIWVSDEYGTRRAGHIGPARK